MKKLTETIEYRAYSEEEAKDFIDEFRAAAPQNGYTVKSAGWTRKEKKAKGEVVAEAWVVKCTACYNAIWDEGDTE